MWHSPKYRRYLKSPEWAHRKEQHFVRLPRRCAACGTYKRIQLHHSSYERLTREPDSDLWPLCFTCHRNVHRAHDTGRFECLEAATIFIVQRGRSMQWRRKRARRLVATGHARDAIGIDLDERNADLARERCGMFVTVEDWRA